MSDDILNIELVPPQQREAFNLVVDVFLTDTQALAQALNILAQRHPEKSPHELMTLIIVSGICATIDEDGKTCRRREVDFFGDTHGS